MQKSLDQKLAAIHADPSGCKHFIIADAKDADMAFGIGSAGRSPEQHAGEVRFRTLAEYRDLGFGIVLFANFLMRAVIQAGAEALAHLLATGETVSYADRIATWQERQSLFHLPEFTAAEAHFDAPGARP